MKMSMKLLLTSWCCHVQDVLLTDGVLGLFPDVLLMGKGHLLEAGALGPASQIMHILIALLITVSLQEKRLAAEEANKCWCSKFFSL